MQVNENVCNFGKGQFIGNKAKGGISRRVLEDNKAS